MDVYQEAVGYLESRHVPVVVEAETEVLEEDVFPECSPVHPESLDLPDTPTLCNPKEMLERRLVLLKGILESEEVYLRELETLLTPMKALRASAGTSQPVLSSQQVQTVFYQVPEIRDMHQSFCSGLKARLTEPALLYKPLDRVTKTTLVLHDLLRTTPQQHGDYSFLQEALRLSRSFLSGINESSQCKREVTLSHGMRRKLMRDGFVVDVSEGERSLRHLFLYTDLLLCTRNKPAAKG
ncbi:Active breakpoint cluster region-related protein [Liparis tanakae]|uniref:Active breakpoint cluster region-related protein n=1 Tax=Liparis tanakae TaxID=230148 RepID=A0A4Z2H1X3_9TELE|nr:Active breakpoint cluster region-related protein [Liparis tanakae]